MLFTHYILTNFNLGQVDNAWFFNRAGLFDKFTVNSILNTCYDFRWIILFDKDTLDTNLELIHEITRKDSRCLLLRLPVSVKFNARHREPKLIYNFLLQQFNVDTKFILTTLIDNDDSVCNSFLSDLYDSVNIYVHEKVTPILFEPKYQIFSNLQCSNICIRRCIHMPTVVPSVLDYWRDKPVTVRSCHHNQLHKLSLSKIIFDSYILYLQHGDQASRHMHKVRPTLNTIDTDNIIRQRFSIYV